MNRQCPLFKLYAVGDNYYAKYFLEISCCCCVGWRRGGGSRGLTRDFAGVFGGSDSGKLLRRVGGRQISRSGCACTQAFGRAVRAFGAAFIGVAKADALSKRPA